MFIFKFIKWVCKTVLIVTGIIPLSRCSSGYREKDGKVTFNGREITDKSFVVLNDVFAKDSTAPYYKERAFQYADVATFEAVDDHYAKDKNKVYYCDEYREGQNYYLTKKQTIKEVDLAIPTSFVSLSGGYAKDSKHAFFIGTAFTVKDVGSFKPLNSSFSKDAFQAYLDGAPITGSDGKSFQLLDEFYAKDTAHIYFFRSAGLKKPRVNILPCNAASFTLLAYPYAKDDAVVFYEGEKIAGADTPSFAVLGYGYSKDKHAVYFGSKQIAAADAASFEVYKENDLSLEEYHYAKDKATVFIDDKIIRGADVASFKILTLAYCSDNKQVFYKANVVKGASPASFKTNPDGYGDTDAEDAASKYLKGRKVIVE